MQEYLLKVFKLLIFVIILFKIITKFVYYYLKNKKILLWIARKLLRQAPGYPCEQRATSRMLMGFKRTTNWNEFCAENKKRKDAAALEEKRKQEAAQIHMALAQLLLSTPTSHVSRVVLAQPVPIQATTSVAAYVTAHATEVVTDAAAAAQELAIEVLSTLTSLEEERTDTQALARAPTPVDFEISEIVAHDKLVYGLISSLSHP